MPTKIKWSPDGRWIVISSTLGVYIYDSRIFDERFIPTNEVVPSFAISPDSHIIATGGEQLRLWNLETGQLINDISGFPLDVVIELAFNPSGDLLAVFSANRNFGDAGEAMLSVWRINDGALLYTQDAYGAGVIGDNLHFINHGTVIGWVYSNSLVRVDAITGARLPELNITIVSNIVSTPTGDQLALVDKEKTYQLMNIDTGESQSWLDLEKIYLRLILDPTGQRLLAQVPPHDERKRYSSHVWDLHTGQMLKLIETTHELALAAFSPDGKQLASIGEEGDHPLTLIDMSTYEVKHKLSWSASITAAAFGVQKGNPVLVIGDTTGVVRLIDPVGRDMVEKFQAADWEIQAIALNPNGESIAISFTSPADNITVTKVIHLTSHRILSEYTNGTSIEALTFSQDGEALLATNHYMETMAWIWKNNQEVKKPGQKLWQSGQVPGIDWQGHLIEPEFPKFTFNQVTVNFVDRMMGGSILQVEDLDPEFICQDVWQYAVSSDRRFLALGCDRDAIPVWDLSTGKLVARFGGHRPLAGDGFYGVVTGINFAPYGHLLATAGYDGTVRFWDLTTSENLLTLRSHTETVNRALFSADGRFLVTYSQDGTLRLWGLVTQ